MQLLEPLKRLMQRCTLSIFLYLSLSLSPCLSVGFETKTARLTGPEGAGRLGFGSKAPPSFEGCIPLLRLPCSFHIVILRQGIQEVRGLSPDPRSPHGRPKILSPHGLWSALTTGRVILCFGIKDHSCRFRYAGYVLHTDS